MRSLIAIVFLGMVSVSIHSYCAEQPKTEAKKTAQPTKTDKRGTIELPLIIKITPADDEAKKSANQQQHENDKAFYDSLIAYATVALAVITLGLAYFTGRLWWITKDLVRGSEKTAERQLRAYIAVENIFFPERDIALAFRSHVNGELIPTYTDTLSIRISNYGQTPAHDVEMWREIIATTPEDFRYPYGTDGRIAGRQMLHPSQRYMTGIGWPANVTPEFLFTHTSRFNVYGRIIYRDIYGRWWKTTYGYTHQGHSRFTPDQSYNQECGPFKNREKAIAS